MGDFEMDKNGDFKESSKDKLNRAIASMCDEWLLIGFFLFLLILMYCQLLLMLWPYFLYLLP